LVALSKFGSFRLAAVVHVLKEEGMKIKTTTINEGGKSYASYSVEK